MTLHSAKGLEFENVFIIAVEQEVLPHIRSMYNPSQLEEERRLFFVGITRAKSRLQLSTARTRGFNSSKMSSPSPFLVELPRAEMEIVDKSEPFGFGSDFADEGHGDSFREEWESRSFMHSGKKNKAGLDSKPSPSSKRKRVALESDSRQSQPEEWEESQEVVGSEDVIFRDLDADMGSSIDSEQPAGLEQISKKLARLNKQIPQGGLKTALQVSCATTLNGIPVDRFQAGDHVLHPTYGNGSISSVEGKGLRRMARVVFSEGESKSFQLSKSKLELA
jgi:DNA helicase II / ATP-dependent DNA helicase PcrA